jgi:hypothetical protein
VRLGEARRNERRHVIGPSVRLPKGHHGHHHCDHQRRTQNHHWGAAATPLVIHFVTSNSDAQAGQNCPTEARWSAEEIEEEASLSWFDGFRWKVAVQFLGPLEPRARNSRRSVVLPHQCGGHLWSARFQLHHVTSF